MSWTKLNDEELREKLKPVMSPADVAVFVAYRKNKHFAAMLDTVLP